MSLVKPSINLVARACEGMPSGILPSLTFTRASGAWRRSRSGRLERVAPGMARHDYDPMNADSLGMLIEPSRTNLCTYGDQLDQWNKARATVSPNVSIAPDGTTTFDKVIEDGTASSVHSVNSPSVAVAAGATYTASIYARAAERTKMRFGFLGASGNALADFDLGSGTCAAFSTAYTGVSAVVERGPNGTLRCIVTGTVVTDTSVALTVSLLDAQSNAVYTGNGTSGFFAGCAQLEAGAYSTSFIQTAAASATRSADLLSMPLPSGIFANGEGTLYVEAVLAAPPTQVHVPVAVALTDGTSSNFVAIGYNQVSAKLYAQASNGGATVWAPNVGVLTTPFRVAASFKSGAFALSVNGGTPVTQSTGAPPANLNMLNVGHLAGGNNWAGMIRHVSVWPRALALSDLQTIAG